MDLEKREQYEIFFRKFFDESTRDLSLRDTKKIIFLDVDGVLTDNTGLYYKIDEDRVKRLKKIIDATGAEVVLCSTRRRAYRVYVTEPHRLRESSKQNMDELQGMLDKYGISILDWTIDIGNRGYITRPYEIKVWLMQRTDIASFVILDDDPWIWEWLKTHVVRTIRKDPEREYNKLLGLEDEHVERAIEILNQFDGEKEEY